MQKNIASQKLIVFAFDSTTNLPKSGDAANITAYVSKDYGSVTVLADTSATEMEATNAKGYYLFDLAQAETNADTLFFSGKSTTANIVVVGVPATVFTTAPNFNATQITSGGIVQADLQTIKTQTVTCSAGVTVNVNVGTTQPVNFTGTAGSALVKSDTVDIAGTAAPATSGVLDVRLADAVGHGGTTATLALQNVSVISPAGDAVLLQATDNAGGKALHLESATGQALYAHSTSNYGGYFISDNQTGLVIFGGPLGLLVSNNSGDSGSPGAAAMLTSYNGPALWLQPTFFGSAPVTPALFLDMSGANTPSPAVVATTAGIGAIPAVNDCILLNPREGNGITIAPETGGTPGNHPGISVFGVGTSPAVQLGNGTDGAEALKLLAGTDNTNADALSAVGAGNGHGFNISAGTSGSGDGFHVTAGATGHGINSSGGFTSGDGIFLQASAGIGFEITGGTGGISITAGGGNHDILLAGDGILQGNLGGTIDGLTALGLATLFTVDSTKLFSDAVTGSPVKEIATHATVVSGAPTVAEIATALFTDLLASSDFSTAGSFGKLIKDDLDAQVSTRLATSGYTAPDNTSITDIKAKTDNLPSDPADESLIIAATDLIKGDTAAIKLKTDNLPASPAAVGSAMTLTSGERNSVADAHIARNIAGGSSTGRLVGHVYAAARNKISFDVPGAGQYTVFGVDDVTPVYVGTYTRSAVNNLTGVDPTT